MNKVYIDDQSLRKFNDLRIYLIKYFKLNSKSLRLIKTNLKSSLNYFVICGVIFENRRAFK